ncbi:hypothetical protein [Adhaeribacter rhizoryzae]|uniref:Uncharacterized protein n=1 Tax=Adhaeribacter rhizoryzae TaxID=2607907 RepID=A0A5M6DPU0_9BACT|nr:hypothetical protein [Adhaeribacter rhizoryzae]KAA5548229.1 hypothetical protein F0145_05735 [Adhaeribacter rhizoryzae]
MKRLPLLVGYQCAGASLAKRNLCLLIEASFQLAGSWKLPLIKTNQLQAGASKHKIFLSLHAHGDNIFIGTRLFEAEILISF